MKNFRFHIALLIVLMPLSLFAQLKLPTFDVALKLGVMSTTDDYNTGNFRLEGNVHINQFVAAGIYYSRSFWGQLDDLQVDDFRDLKQQMYGVRIQGSTGRISKFRPYVFITYSKLESVEAISPNLNFAGDWNGITFGGGLMIRLANRVYLNIPEFEYIPAGGKFFFVDSDKNFIALRLGANVVLGKNR